jgi:hypothetical protein
VIDCTWLGTVYVTDNSSADFFSATFAVCDPGSYAVGRGSSRSPTTCQPCVYGATCEGGSETSDGLRALPGFWGSVTTGAKAARFHVCPSGYCCARGAECGLSDCQGGRAGRLCGRCAEGSGRQFFSESCRDSESCKDAGWAAAVVLIGALGFCVYLVATWESPPSAVVSILLFFYQALPMVKSTAWAIEAAPVVVALQSVFSLSPSGSRDDKAGAGSRGVCVIASMAEDGRLEVRSFVKSE